MHFCLKTILGTDYKRFFVNSILINRVHLGDPARSLQDSVAFPEIPPPHVLVGDLDDVSHGEPALLSV